MKLLFKSLLIITIIAVVALLLSLVYAGYDQTVYFAAKITNSLNRLDKFKVLFSVKTFKGLIALLAFVVLALILLLWQFGLIYSLFAKFISRAGAAFRFRLKNDWSGPVFLCLIIIPIAASVYYTLTIPVDWDEAYTYIKFTSRSIFSCITYYPAPNNHILFSALTSIFLHLPFRDLVSMRVPSILVNILCLLFLFSFVKEYYNKYIAYATIAVFSSLHMSILYSFLSRGYGLQSLCFILMTYSIFKIVGRADNKLYWAYYSIACILGFYTMPSFLYAFTAGNLFLLASLMKPTKYYLVSSVSIVCIAIFLYVPIVLFNGLDALIHNEFIIPLKRVEVIQKLPFFFFKILHKLTRLPEVLDLVVICAGAFFMLRNYKGAMRLYFPAVMVICPLLLIIHSVIPFERTFEYYNVIFALFAGIVVCTLLGKYAAKQYVYGGLILLQLLLVYKFDILIHRDETKAYEAQEAIPSLRQGKNFYLCTSLFDLFLMYDMRVRKVNDYNIKFKQIRATDMDTIIDHKHEYYVIDTDSDRTVTTKPIFRNNYVTIYK